MKPIVYAFSISVFALCNVVAVSAQTHKGKMDTDGILSKGELRNPRINYQGEGKNRGRGPSTSAPHRGKMDTDGILSQGEIANPNINYRGVNYGNRPPPSAPHAGKVDSDGILSRGEIANPLIDYNRQRQDPYWYSNNGWDQRWDRYDEGYWRQHPDRQWWGNQDNYWRRDDSFNYALRDAMNSGRISRREEVELKGMRADLFRAEQQYWSDGRLSDWERRELEQRSADLQRSFKHELNDGEYR